MDKIEEGASSEVDNFDMWQRSSRSICRLEAFRLFVVMLQLVVKVFETLPAYSKSK